MPEARAEGAPIVTNEALVSVVVPFYNTARYLDACIASVHAQSHANFELILQDNASTDGSSEIARQWAARDPRVKYFRLDELIPQVPNYNLALTRIAPDSDFTKIVQADDWIYRDCLRSMVELAQEHPKVGLVSSYRLKGEAVHGEGLPIERTVLPGADAARMHLQTRAFLFGSPTTVLYRSEAVRGRRPFYSEGRLHEDTEACFEILRDWDFGFVHQILSYSREDPSSTYGRMRDFDTGILDRYIVVDRFGKQFLAEHEALAARQEVEGRYYRRLAIAALGGRAKAYWDFQRKGLATQQMQIDPARLARAIGRQLLSTVACPVQFGGIVSGWWARLSGRQAKST
jgi:glycosyltransferase involved in cell wall biosynthesis